MKIEFCSPACQTPGKPPVPVHSAPAGPPATIGRAPRTPQPCSQHHTGTAQGRAGPGKACPPVSGAFWNAFALDRMPGHWEIISSFWLDLRLLFYEH